MGMPMESKYHDRYKKETKPVKKKTFLRLAKAGYRLSLSIFQSMSAKRSNLIQAEQPLSKN